MLSAPFGDVRAEARACEQPQNDETGERLDEGVGAEADQRDRSGGEAGGDRDRGFEKVIPDPAPGEQTRLLLELAPLDERIPERDAHRRQLDQLVAQRVA